MFRRELSFIITTPPARPSRAPLPSPALASCPLALPPLFAAIYFDDRRKGIRNWFRILCRRLICAESFVDESFNYRFRMRAFFRFSSDQSADLSLLHSPTTHWRVFDSEYFAVLVAQVLRECSYVPIIDISITPILGWC